MLRRFFDPSLPHPYLRYGRMSHEVQNPRSPEQQFETIEMVRKRSGFPWVYVRDYRDDAVTGRLLRKRKDFQQMLLDIRTGTVQVDLILVDTFERFGRADEVAQIRRELHDKYGVLVLTADSSFSDPTSVAGRALSFVEQIRSTEDGRVKAHNVLRGKRDLIRQKKAWPGGPPPRGFRLKSIMKVGKTGEQEVDYKILEPNPEIDWVYSRLFHLARDTGWGTLRLARAFNADPTIPSTLKPFTASSIGYILDNPIYYGELLWEKHATGIVNDKRVRERNAEEEMIRVPDFCKPIVSRALWEEVQELRRKRREQRARQRRRPSVDGKQLIPRGTGLTLKYLLTGLARCGDCGLSLRPIPCTKTTKSGEVWRRVYYVCPGYLERACCNGIYVPEDSLREAAIGRLRNRLFPAPESSATPPNWLGPLVDEIRQEVQRRKEEQPDECAAWSAEVKDLEDRLNGWSQSLANPRLDTTLRMEIETRYGHARARISQLQALSAEHDARKQRVDEIVSAEQILERLRRLADILANGNPTRGNLELALHIDRIDCFADSAIVMRTSRLGSFDGAVELLRGPKGAQAGPEPATHVADGLRTSRARRRSPLNVDVPISNHPLATASGFDVTDPRRFEGLDPKWFWEDRLEIVPRLCWAAKNSAEVAKLRFEGYTIDGLAKHFRKAPQTIRSALKKAGNLQCPKKMPRRKWYEDHAVELLQLKQSGKTTLELAHHFEKSDTSIRTALKDLESRAQRGDVAGPSSDNAESDV